MMDSRWATQVGGRAERLRDRVQALSNWVRGPLNNERKINRANRLYEAKLLATKNGEVIP